MTTFSVIKSRIADDLNRDDIATQIGIAINRAIKFYETEKFFFNEGRTTFSTVANQQTYTEAQMSATAGVKVIDYASISISNTNQELQPITYQELQRKDISGLAGYPDYVAIYNKTLYMYPKPNSTWTVTLSYQPSYDELSADADTNAFITHAADLIEARARWWISSRITKDKEEAQDAKTEEIEALYALRRKTMNLLSTGLIEPCE